MRRYLPLALPHLTVRAPRLSAADYGADALMVRAPFYGALRPALTPEHSRRALPDDSHTTARPVDATLAVVRPAQTADGRRWFRNGLRSACRQRLVARSFEGLGGARVCIARLSHHDVRLSFRHMVRSES